MQEKSISLAIFSLFFLTLVITATYAFFDFKLDADNGSIEALINTPKVNLAFTSNVGNDLSLNIDINDMSTPSTTPLTNDTSTIEVALSGGTSEKNASCTYDIYFAWDNEKYTKTTSLPATDDEMNSYPFELSIKGSSAIEDGASDLYEAKELSEINIDDLEYESQKDRYKVISEAKIMNNDPLKPTKVTWTFTMNFYVLPTRQNALIDKNYKGHFVVSNVSC